MSLLWVNRVMWERLGKDLQVESRQMREVRWGPGLGTAQDPCIHSRDPESELSVLCSGGHREIGGGGTKPGT